MAMVKNMKREKFCAICKWIDRDCIIRQDLKSGSVTVDNSNGKCMLNKTAILPTKSACKDFESRF